MNICKKLLPILLAIMLMGFPHAAISQTQDDMNRIACSRQKEVDEKLNNIYRKILVKYQDDKSFINNIKSAQRAWLTYREAHIKSLFPNKNPSEYGTVYAMCRCNSFTEIANNRIKELEQWIDGIEMGDVCTGSRAVK